MSDVIQLLPDAIANQIAAGEVIVRPASVVKELMENAIDAGADDIKLIIKDAGKTLIQVIDNGSGMSETDARMCFERHATSKIRQAADIFHIRTMGFRGEAMASIAAIAHVETSTKLHESDIGVKISIEGCEVVAQEPCTTASGTSTSVKNLFYNVPARRNFLKSNTVESKHIMEEFQRVALAYPKINFSLHNNGLEIFNLKNGNLRQRIVGIFGRNYNDRLVPIEEGTDVVRLKGFIGKPEFARKTRGEQYFFVNNRFIKSGYFHHAVMAAYEDLIPQGNYPLYVICFDIDPEKIDVNVHPTKQEIKFEEEKIIYAYLKSAIKRGIGKYSIAPTLDFDRETSFDNLKPSEHFSIEKASPFAPKEGFENNSWVAANLPIKTADKPTPVSTISKPMVQHRPSKIDGQWEELYKVAMDTPVSTPAEQPQQTITEEYELEAGKPIQLHRRYIISSIKSGYILISQQLAHQKVLYHRYLDALEEQHAPTQRQLFPTQFSLGPSDAAILQTLLPQINGLGFDIQMADVATFVVHGVPANVGSINEQEVIEGMIEQYKMELDSITDGSKHTIARLLANKTAIKPGKVLSHQEMQVLIDELFACPDFYTAPGGQKTFISYSTSELEQAFANRC